MHVVTQKLDLDQTSVAPTHTEKTLIKLTFLTEKLYRLTEGWFWNISLLPVPCTDCRNSVAEALNGVQALVDRDVVRRNVVSPLALVLLQTCQYQSRRPVQMMC